MSEQQSEPATSTTTATETGPSDAWGQPISPERQAETDHGERRGPFDNVKLMGADVSWLAEQSGRDEYGNVPNLHLERANLRWAHLEAANLNAAHLEHAILSVAYLERTNLNAAHLEGADLSLAQLEGAFLYGSFQEGAHLYGAHLEHANLTGAQLESTFLSDAHLEGADLTKAHLEHANLTGAWFDKASHMKDAILTGVHLDQVSFDQTNLTVVDWSLVDILGDEQTARTRNGADGKPKDRYTRLTEYKRAVRANRILAVALQAQGLSEDASRFAYRAQVLQREACRRQRKIGAYLFSLLIAALAGYGYRLGRILIAYGLSLAVFAAVYFAAGQWFGATHLIWYQAILVSLTAIHGRVFFESFGLNTIESWVAAVESVVGIVIEGVFVAMLIQRFFGR